MRGIFVSNKFVVIDLETTGHSPKNGDKIIQFAAVVVVDGKIIDQYSSFVHPGKEIPPFIEELTGITDDMVKSAPEFAEIAPKVLTMLDNAYFVAHNVLFDLSFLQEELIHAGYEGFLGPVLDTVEMARVLLPTADSYKLTELALQEGLNHERPHQADSDAYVTAELLMILLEKLASLPKITLEQLLKHSGGLKSDVALLLDEILLEKELSIDELPYSLEYHRGIVFRRSQDEEKTIARSRMEFPKSDAEKIAILSSPFENFEERTGQFKMMDSIFSSFTEGKHALIEAGTGVGKSLAYLFPAAIYAREHHETIVISTYTTQLQEQLLKKDIPLLERILSFELQTALLKGRSHYISLAKFEQALREVDDNYDISLTKMQILVWLMETETGDRDELNLSSGGKLYWDKLKNDDATYDLNKSWLSYDFYLRARKMAQTADFIITNHSFLLSDMVSDQSILPSYHYCVLDEGHHFEKAAGKYFGYSLDYLEVRLLLNRFGLYEQKGYQSILDGLLQEKMTELTIDVMHSFELEQIFADLIYEMDGFFSSVAIIVMKKVKGLSGSNRLTYRIKAQKGAREYDNMHATGERFYFLLKSLNDYIHTCVNGFITREITLTKEQNRFIRELSSYVKELEHLQEAIKKIIIHPLETSVTWAEVDAKAPHNTTTIYTQPVTIAEALREKFFQDKKSVIITSATLSVKGSFHYIMKELGLNESSCHVELIPSPFQYEEQVQLVIPNDLPEIKSVAVDEYVAAISEHIITIAEATKGRMLILFTSYDMLRKTYHLIKESGLLEEYVLMGQGISGGSRTRLTRNFQRFDKAILLGTSSFWEGIDIPGEDLSCLIIVRLPFSPPNEPITEAKCQYIEENGGNPFSEYSLPEAIIRFKQGFGRLIRTSRDRGLVIVFDKRIYTTSYGKTFLQSIPNVPVQKLGINETVDLIHDWL